jgi:hypothetical protein
MTATCVLANKTFPARSVEAGSLHIPSGDRWFVVLFRVQNRPAFSSGRTFVRDSVDYFSRCQRSRLLPCSRLPAFVCGGRSISSRNDWSPAPALAPFTGVVCVGFGGATILIATAYLVPVAPVDSAWARHAFKVNGDYREEIGWPEVVQQVAEIRDSLGPLERSRVAVLAGNYGEGKAVNLYGKEHGLPEAMCGTNSFWRRGYGDPPPETLIVIRFSQAFRDQSFRSCELVGRITNKYGVAKEETTDYPDMFICRHLRESWPEFWKKFHRYG